MRRLLFFITLGVSSCALGDTLDLRDDNGPGLLVPPEEVPPSLSVAEQNCVQESSDCATVRCVYASDCMEGQACMKNRCVDKETTKKKLLRSAEVFEEGKKETKAPKK